MKTHFTAAENRKSLLTVTQSELAHCIFERIMKDKTSFLKKLKSDFTIVTVIVCNKNLKTNQISHS